MNTELTLSFYSKELKFLNWNQSHPKAAAGISTTNNLGECLVATRMQHERKSKMSDSQQSKRSRADLLPILYVTSQNVGGKLPTCLLIVLLDSGSSHTMVKQSSLPHGAILTTGTPKRTTTTNGVFSTTSFVTIQQVKFPEFGNHCITEVMADVFNSPTCRYNIILGRNILDLMGAKIDFQTNGWVEKCR